MSHLVRIGIISLGGAGRAHLRRFRKNCKAKVIALFDPKPEVIRYFTKEQQDIVVATTSLDEFYACRQIQAVSICSPDYEHANHSLRALSRGWHVLCEKPLTTNLSDCDRITSEVHKTGLKFMTHHQLRYLPTFSKAKGLIASGGLGRVFALEADYYHYMRLRAAKFDGWRTDPTSYQNIVLGGGCHPIDLMQWLIGDRIIEVFAYANHVAWPEYPGMDTVMALFTFSGGAIGKMTMAISCRRPQYHPLVVMGTKGTLVNGLLFDESGVRRILHFPKHNLSWSRRFLGRIIGKCRDIVQYPFDHNEHNVACEALIDQFLDCVLYNTPVPIPIQESVDAVRVCLAVIESYEKGKPAKVQRP